MAREGLLAEGERWVRRWGSRRWWLFTAVSCFRMFPDVVLGADEARVEATGVSNGRWTAGPLAMKRVEKSFELSECGRLPDVVEISPLWMRMCGVLCGGLMPLCVWCGVGCVWGVVVWGVGCVWR